jgi:Flp pilus assembly CpaF family ATPase
VTTGISSPVSTFTKKNEIKAAESGSLSDQRIDKRSPWLRARLATGSRICSTGG